MTKPSIKNGNKFENQSGQALLFIVVAVTVALAIGVAVSSRTVGSLRRVATTDTSAKVYSTAEGGVEYFLAQPIGVLRDMSDGSVYDSGDGSCQCPTGTTCSDGGQCLITSTPVTGDLAVSRARVSVEEFNYNKAVGDSNEEHYDFTLEPGDVKEVVLSYLGDNYNGNLQICWTSRDIAEPSVLYYSYYNNTGVLTSRFILDQDSSHSSDIGTTAAGLIQTASNSGSHTDYYSCQLVNIPSSPQPMGIRIKSLYAPSKIGIYPQGARDLPQQGFKITSVGELVQGESVKTTKTVAVYRSLPYMPAIFDYAIYSGSELRAY